MRIYCVAMLKEETPRKGPKIKPLYTKKFYTRGQAQAKVDALEKTYIAELKHLGFDRFVVYNIFSE